MPQRFVPLAAIRWSSRQEQIIEITSRLIHCSEQYEKVSGCRSARRRGAAGAWRRGRAGRAEGAQRQIKDGRARREQEQRHQLGGAVVDPEPEPAEAGQAIGCAVPGAGEERRGRRARVTRKRGRDRDASSPSRSPTRHRLAQRKQEGQSAVGGRHAAAGAGRFSGFGSRPSRLASRSSGEATPWDPVRCSAWR